MKKIILVSLLFIFGCRNYDININVVKSYEGHYFNTNDFYKATQNISLSNNESIWVLSNTTLKNILTNLEK